MNVIVQSKNLKITQALREYLKKQLEKLPTRYKVNKVTAFIETVSRKKNDIFASVVRLHIDVPGKNLVVERRGVDLYDTIVDVSERAQRVLRKQKEKRINRARAQEHGYQKAY